MKSVSNIAMAFLSVTAILCGCNDAETPAAAPAAEEKHIEVHFNADNRAVSITNLKQLGSAIMMYSYENDDCLPAFPGLVVTSLGRTDIFVAPWDKKSVASPYDSDELNKLDHIEKLNRLQSLIASGNSSYAWLIPDGKIRTFHLEESKTLPLALEKPWLFPEKTDEIGVLYADGHVETVNIPGVSDMNCRQIMEILLAKSAESEKVKAEFLTRAAMEDASRHWGQAEFNTLVENAEKLGYRFSDDKYTLFRCAPDIKGSMELPAWVVTIAGYAFARGGQEITGITLPESVMCIKADAFYGCRNLTAITIPASVTVIEKEAFNGCTNLKEVIIHRDYAPGTFPQACKVVKR